MISVRFAETDADVVAIHAFLCCTAGPLLPAPIDPKKSATEVWRVVNEEFALMAILDDKLVGTIGIVRPEYWWGDAHFLANRWFFALPGLGAGKLLLKEATSIARDSALELHIIDEAKERYVILNRSPKRLRENPYLARPAPEQHPQHPTFQ